MGPEFLVGLRMVCAGQTCTSFCSGGGTAAERGASEDSCRCWVDVLVLSATENLQCEIANDQKVRRTDLPPVSQ
jgi:hypothetical protein